MNAFYEQSFADKITKKKKKNFSHLFSHSLIDFINMKFAIVILVIFIFVALSEQQNVMLYAIGKRQLDDYLITIQSNRSTVYEERQDAIGLRVNYDLGEGYWTMLEIQIPEALRLNRYNATTNLNHHKVDVIVFISNATEAAIDVKIYGYDYEPGAPFL